MFPKNIPQSILFTIILIVTSFVVHVFFEFFFKSETDFLRLMRRLFSYVLPYLVLSYLAKKKITDYSLSNTKYNISFLLILISLTFTLTIGLPSFYLLSSFFDVEIMQIRNNTLFFSLLAIALFPAIFEELIIKGILFENLIKNNSLIKSIIITTIIFSALHMSIPKLPLLILDSIFTCYIYYKTRNVLYAMLIHLTANAISVFEYLLIQPASGTVTLLNIYGNNTVFILIVSFLLLMISLYRLRQHMKIHHNVVC